MRPTINRYLSILTVVAGIVLFPLFSASPAQASSCDGTFCHYTNQGNSGAGAWGTGGEFIVPTTMYNVPPSSDDTVAFMVWMWGSLGTGWWSSIETGMVYGFRANCGTFNAYFFPYGTKDDGGTESDDCGYAAYPGQTFQLWSFHPGGGTTALSQVDTNGANIWSSNWGIYTDSVEYDNDSWAEVWGLQGQPTPYWSLNAKFDWLGWEHDDGSWSNWGSLSIQNDCPYHGTQLSNDAWQPKGYSCNGGQP